MLLITMPSSFQTWRGFAAIAQATFLTIIRVPYEKRTNSTEETEILHQNTHFCNPDILCILNSFVLPLILLPLVTGSYLGHGSPVEIFGFGDSSSIACKLSNILP
uniref:Uncharacterized protein n=1 Tax=Sphaerodactylus townsendi TaxID=933632 RepID=A0ACB8FS97_9SAUR